MPNRDKVAEQLIVDSLCSCKKHNWAVGPSHHEFGSAVDYCPFCRDEELTTARDALDLATAENGRLTKDNDRWVRWSRLTRTDFAEFNLVDAKLRHEIADAEGTCDFQTMHNDRKCLIEEIGRLQEKIYGEAHLLEENRVRSVAIAGQKKYIERLETALKSIASCEKRVDGDVVDIAQKVLLFAGESGNG